MIEFGEKLKSLRESKGITQQTLADQLYVTRQAVSRWECGARYPDLLTAKRIAQALDTKKKKGLAHKELPTAAKQLEGDPAIKLCGIEKILDRGLKYMSTGEIRRTLLARALISCKKLLILSDPFAGLDVQSRTILLDFFDSIARRSNSKNGSAQPHII